MASSPPLSTSPQSSRSLNDQRDSLSMAGHTTSDFDYTPKTPPTPDPHHPLLHHQSPSLSQDQPAPVMMTPLGHTSSSSRQSSSYIPSPLNPRAAPSGSLPRSRRGSIHLPRVASEESQALMSAQAGQRGSMVLWRISTDPAPPLPPPDNRFSRYSIHSTSDASLFSLSEDSKYPINSNSQKGQAGLVAYAYDPEFDTDDPKDDFMEDKKDGGILWGFNLRGLMNISTIIILIFALFCLFALYPILAFYRRKRRRTKNRRERSDQCDRSIPRLVSSSFSIMPDLLLNCGCEDPTCPPSLTPTLPPLRTHEQALMARPTSSSSPTSSTSLIVPFGPATIRIGKPSIFGIGPRAIWSGMTLVKSPPTTKANWSSPSLRYRPSIRPIAVACSSRGTSSALRMGTSRSRYRFLVRTRMHRDIGLGRGRWAIWGDLGMDRRRMGRGLIRTMRVILGRIRIRRSTMVFPLLRLTFRLRRGASMISSCLISAVRSSRTFPLPCSMCFYSDWGV